MMNFFKKLFGIKPSFIHGVIPEDPLVLSRQPKLEEMVASVNPVVWTALDISKIPNYKVRNQNGSSGCVAFTLSLMSSILYFIRTGQWVDFSPAWIYSKRANKPQPGMVSTNAFEIAQKGMLPDDFLPSDNKDEEYLNNPPNVFDWFNKMSEVFSLDTKLVILPVKDIETVASVIQTTGKPVMVWFQFGDGEWGAVPKIVNNNPPYHHSVTTIPPSKAGEQTIGIYEGEKAIVIQDSWGRDLGTINGKRIIKQSFFNKRNTFAAYPIRFKFDAVDSKPTYDGTTVSLQNCLKYEKCFPVNIDSTGFFGNITIEAVKKFQSKYGIQQTGNVGPMTEAKLRQLFT